MSCTCSYSNYTVQDLHEEGGFTLPENHLNMHRENECTFVLIRLLVTGTGMALYYNSTCIGGLCWHNLSIMHGAIIIII